MTTAVSCRPTSTFSPSEGSWALAPRRCLCLVGSRSVCCLRGTDAETPCLPFGSARMLLNRLYITTRCAHNIRPRHPLSLSATTAIRASPPALSWPSHFALHKTLFDFGLGASDLSLEPLHFTKHSGFGLQASDLSLCTSEDTSTSRLHLLKNFIFVLCTSRFRLWA